jgi:cysteine dioxygenase
MRWPRLPWRRPDPACLLGWPLPERPEDVLAADQLAERLLRAKLDLSTIARALRFDERGYARRVLARTPACELVLACWLPRQGTPIHDHGGSSGATVVVGGALAERTYVSRPDRGLEIVDVRRVGEGEPMVEHPETIHLVQNAGRSPAFSLHLYAPPLVRMQRYAPPEPIGAVSPADAAMAALRR